MLLALAALLMFPELATKRTPRPEPAPINFTASPNRTVRAYAEPFISNGKYSDVRELADPRAARYDDRFRLYNDAAVIADPGDFNFKHFNSNVVLRWEYRPGSALFLVWQQGRSDSQSYWFDR